MVELSLASAKYLQASNPKALMGCGYTLRVILWNGMMDDDELVSCMR